MRKYTLKYNFVQRRKDKDSVADNYKSQMVFCAMMGSSMILHYYMPFLDTNSRMIRSRIMGRNSSVITALAILLTLLLTSQCHGKYNVLIHSPLQNKYIISRSSSKKLRMFCFRFAI